MNHVHKIREEVLIITIFIASIWLVFLLDTFLPLEKFGLIPRDGSGLFGIIAMTFLHGNFQHLMSNTVPLIVLLLLLSGSQADSRKIVASIIILGGLLLWVFGRSNSIHIGASLLVFGLASFLMVAGILERRTIPMIISIVVAVVYGSTLLSGLLPWQQGVSWEGHLMGGIAGAMTAWLLLKFRANHR
ncbi:MAG TPA: rhomboid family intramembrane serine protease [Leucothrix mucor]|nr:rhomboid family intramembrane serine protease [Leucothrix mucor]